MNKLKTAIRNAEVDGLSDSIIRNFKADEKAQSDSFLKATLEELETLSAQITTAILQDKTLSTLDSTDSARDEAVKTLGTVLAAYAVFPIASKKELSAPLKGIDYYQQLKQHKPTTFRSQQHSERQGGEEYQWQNMIPTYNRGPVGSTSCLSANANIQSNRKVAWMRRVMQ